MGSWAMGQIPATRARKWAFMPFAQWEVQELFLTQRLEDKGEERILPRVGEILWPALMQVPINRYGDWRDMMGPLRKLRPRAGWVHMVRRYSRKRLAR